MCSRRRGASTVRPLLLHPLLFTLPLLALSSTFSLSGNAAATSGLHSDDAAEDSTKEKMQRFERWLAERSLVVESEECPIELLALEVSASGAKIARPEYAGYASRHIRKGEPILVLPRHLQVLAEDVGSPYEPPLPSPSPDPTTHATTPDCASEVEGRTGDAEAKERGKKEERGSWLSGDNVSGWSEFTALAAWVLREKAKGNSSEWAPYIDILPEKVPLAVFLSEEDLSRFEYQPMAQTVYGWQNVFDDEYRLCHPDAVAGASKDDFYWAMSVVISRCFSSLLRSTRASSSSLSSQSSSLVPDEVEEDVEEEGGSAALFPLADMINHANWDRGGWNRERKLFASEDLRKQPTTFRPPPGSEVFYAVRDIEKGEEIYGIYGLHSNDQLLITYGFALHPNENDNFQILTDVVQAVPEFETHILSHSLEGDDATEAIDLVNGVSAAVQNAARNLWKKAEPQKRRQFTTKAEYMFSGHMGFCLWPNGHIDPRLFAAFAVLAYRFGDEADANAPWRLVRPSSLMREGESLKSAMNLEAIVNASLNYGWGQALEDVESDVENAACGDFVSHMSPEDVRAAHAHALHMAGRAVLSMAEHSMASFSRSLTEDEAELRSLERSCSAEEAPHASDKEDKGVQLTASRFRVGKKVILEQAIRRLRKTCFLL